MCRKSDDCTWNKHIKDCLGNPGKEEEEVEEEEDEEGETKEEVGEDEYYVKLDNINCFTGTAWTEPNGQASQVVAGVKNLEECEEQCTRFNNQGDRCVGASYWVKEKECRLYRECNLQKAPQFVTAVRLTWDSVNEVALGVLQ